MPQERLQKFLARAGVASRRRCEELIRDRRIAVNGRVVTESGLKIDPEQDMVTVAGRRVRPQACFTYIMLHKPVGYVTTRRDEMGRPTVMHLLPDEYRHLHYVGRLDYDSSGLLLLTDDGDLTQRLTHPRYQTAKTYRVEVEGHVNQEKLKQLRGGVRLDDGVTAPAQVRIRDHQTGPPRTLLDLTIREGRNRQVRRMMETIGHPVLSLQRSSMGSLQLGDLPEEQYRLLTEKEVAQLRP